MSAYIKIKKLLEKISPTKAKIITILNREELLLKEISPKAGKSQSTVSIHLQELVEAGVVCVKSDFKDRRKKTFYLNPEIKRRVS